MNIPEEDFPKSRKKEADNICKYFYVDIHFHPVCSAPQEKRNECGRFSTEKGLAGFSLDPSDAREFILYRCDKLKGQCDKLGHLPEGIALKYRYAISDGKIAALTHDLVEDKMKIHRKVGRNESCPCGSGKKYKRCCGR